MSCILSANFQPTSSDKIMDAVSTLGSYLRAKNRIWNRNDQCIWDTKTYCPFICPWITHKKSKSKFLLYCLSKNRRDRQLEARMTYKRKRFDFKLWNYVEASLLPSSFPHSICQLTWGHFKKVMKEHCIPKVSKAISSSLTSIYIYIYIYVYIYTGLKDTVFTE